MGQEATIAAKELLDHGDELFSRTPTLTTLHITDAALAGLKLLTMHNCAFGNEGLREFARASTLVQLRQCPDRQRPNG